jgi:radical SAM superfamily enzyme YgiQ (UPF0313 family)
MNMQITVSLLHPTGSLSGSAGAVRNYSGLEPISIEYLAAYLEERHGAKVFLHHPAESAEEFRQSFSREMPDILGISVYTYSVPVALTFARIAKDIHPKVFIVCGGYHPTAASDEFIQHDCIDAIVIGEGEYTFGELVNRMIARETIEGIPGLVYKTEGRIYRGGKRSRIEALDNLPWPKRIPGIIKSARCHQVMLPAPSDQTGFAQMLYSRGCPNSCDYCISPQVWHQRVVWRNPRNVLDEVEYLRDTYGVNLFYFIDHALNTSKTRLLALTDEFIRRKPGVSWYGLFNPDIYDAEILDALKASGCVKLSIGIEGGSEEAFRLLKGKRWEGFEHTYDFFDMAWSRGLITRAFLMIGNQWDSEAYYSELKHFLSHAALDDIRLVFTTPFPGTKLYDRIRQSDALLTKDYARYTTQEPVIKTQFSSEKLREIHQDILGGFYASSAYLNRIADRSSCEPIFIKSYREHFEFIGRQSDISQQVRTALNKANESLSFGVPLK